MRYLLIIATILLIAEHSNVSGLFKLTGANAIIAWDDPETEEEKKTEKDKKYKTEKLNYYFDYSTLLTFLARQKIHAHNAGLCLKGHCAIIEQPPEA